MLCARRRWRPWQRCGLRAEPVQALFAIAVGASLGAWLRWGLGLWLNPLSKMMPLGTLAANLLGGLLVGIAFAAFDQHPHWPQSLKLLCITGFLGGLTTFSTFSAEIIALLQSGKLGYACAAILIHVIGSLLFTILGMSLHQWLTAA